MCLQHDPQHFTLLVHIIGEIPDFDDIIQFSKAHKHRDYIVQYVGGHVRLNKPAVKIEFKDEFKDDWEQWQYHLRIR